MGYRGLGAICQRFCDRWPIYWADVCADPRWAMMFALSRFEFVRVALAGAERRKQASGAAPQSDQVELGATCTHIVAQIRECGIYEGLQLKRSTVRSIRSFAGAVACKAKRSQPGFLAREYRK